MLPLAFNGEINSVDIETDEHGKLPTLGYKETEVGQERLGQCLPLISCSFIILQAFGRLQWNRAVL